MWLDAATAAAVLACTRHYVARLARRERIPATRWGQRWWFRRRDMEQYVAARAFEARLDPDHRLPARACG